MRVRELLGVYHSKNVATHLTCAFTAATWTHQNRTATLQPNVHRQLPVTHSPLISPVSPFFAHAADGSCRHDRGRGRPSVHTLAPAHGH